MSDTPTVITAEDLAAALTAFAIGMAAAVRTPGADSPEDVLRSLSLELKDMAGRMSQTPAAKSIEITVAMLDASATSD